MLNICLGNYFRNVSLGMDAMAINPFLVYAENTDKIKGYEDTNNQTISSNVADQTLVLSIRGLCSHWKQVTISL